jgi:hypothetical protein
VQCIFTQVLLHPIFVEGVTLFPEISQNPIVFSNDLRCYDFPLENGCRVKDILMRWRSNWELAPFCRPLCSVVQKLGSAGLFAIRKLNSRLSLPKLMLRLAMRYFVGKAKGLTVPLGGSFWKRPPYQTEPRLKIVVISLDSRADRRKHIERHFLEMGLAFSFVPGVPHPNGEVGCADAHIDALSGWIPSNEELLMVCEDDLVFIRDRATVYSLIREFDKNAAIDVLCIGNNSKGPFISVSDSLALTVDTQTASCYVLKPHAVAPMVKVFRRSRAMLAQGGSGSKWAIDILWKSLQRESMVFCIPRSQVAHQIASFSDIQGRWVDYKV